MADLRDIFNLLRSEPPKDGGKDQQFIQKVMDWIESSAGRETRPGDTVRASTVHDICARREALFNFAPHLDRALPSRSAGQVLTLDRGKQEHKWWQNRYLGPMGPLWCSWCCLRCSPLEPEPGSGRERLKPCSVGLMPERCPNCSAPRVLDDQDVIVYGETLVKDNELHYTGHPDGLLIEPPNTRPTVLLELKTIAPDSWMKLTEPDPDHLQQIHVYMRSLEVTEAWVVYLDKGKQADWSFSSGHFQAKNPHIKAFRVQFSLKLWGQIEQRLKDYHRARGLMTLPRAVTPEDVATFPRTCESATCRRASGCPAKTECFSLKVTGE